MKGVDIVQIWNELFNNLQDVILGVDFYYMNGVAIFYSISRKIGYRIFIFPMSRSAISIVKEIKKIKIYNARGFRIARVYANKELEKVEEDLLSVRIQ